MVTTYSLIQQSAETPGNKPTSRAVVRMQIEVLVKVEIHLTDGA